MPVKIHKETKAAYPMQFCPVVKHINLLRRKWMLPLLLELFTLKKPIRFSVLQRALHPITPKLLTQRLKDLEKEGFLAKNKLDYNEVEYELTKEIEILRELVSFLKSDCIRHSQSAKTQCSTCKEKDRCVLAYGV
ncbi:MAG: winged helix-turn-helix transcriptional regulator [Candidatus Norongarragalinales archaeon]